MQNDLEKIKKDAEAAQTCLVGSPGPRDAVANLEKQVSDLSEELLKTQQLLTLKTRGVFEGPLLSVCGYMPSGDIVWSDLSHDSFFSVTEVDALCSQTQQLNEQLDEAKKVRACPIICYLYMALWTVYMMICFPIACLFTFSFLSCRILSPKHRNSRSLWKSVKRRMTWSWSCKPLWTSMLKPLQAMYVWKSFFCFGPKGLSSLRSSDFHRSMVYCSWL